MWYIVVMIFGIVFGTMLGFVLREDLSEMKKRNRTKATKKENMLKGQENSMSEDTVCRICGESTFDVSDDYIGLNGNHIGCELESSEEIEKYIGEGIPKILHQIWLGDRKPPFDLINSWRDAHPDWAHIFWDEQIVAKEFPDGLKNQKQFDAEKTLWGKADILRYEILYAFGGVYLDADAKCLRPLTDDLLDNDSFACFENEKVREGVIANGYLGSVKGCSLMEILIDEIPSRDNEHGYAFETVGPMLLTETVEKYAYAPMKVYPSWYFIPEHHTGEKYSGTFEPYAMQYWDSTKNFEEHFENTMKAKKDVLETACKDLLMSIGDDTGRDGLIETPKRWANAWLEITKALREPAPALKMFSSENTEMIVEKDIWFYSICEHHLVPFFGRASIGYVPDGKVVGLSKLARVVEYFGQKPQIQEEMTSQIADYLFSNVVPHGLIVVLEAEHLCMAMRGVKKPGSRAISSAIRGDIDKGEFYMILRNGVKI
tara:strand:+ start:1028 stop:2488 length:1461 start_codon:yes stop_codon:yes gene_type:complete